MDCPNGRDAEAVAELPGDPFVEMLSRLPVKSLCRFKCVSKAWRDVITDPLNRKKLPQTLEGFFFAACSFDDNSDSDDRDGKGIHSDSDNGDGEESRSGGDDSDSDDGDGEESRSDGGDSNKLGGQVYTVNVHFIDVFGRPPLPVDHYFPFLTELPGIQEIIILDGCNGLLLFGCIQGSGKSFNQRYIVSNPATEQWVAVPDPDTEWLFSSIHLIFDPAASSQFHLVEITVLAEVASVRIYSSYSGVWSPVGIDWGDLHNIDDRRYKYAYANGMLYVVFYGGMHQIVVMDVEGNTRKIIPLPLQKGNLVCDYVGQSQGRLHLICHAELDYYGEIPPEYYELSIWVLEDYGTEEWVLKDTVSSLKLFGPISPGTIKAFEVVAIHPDCNLVFLIQHFKDELLSYNMNSKEVCRLYTLGTGVTLFPYVPYFSELSALESKH